MAKCLWLIVEADLYPRRFCLVHNKALIGTPELHTGKVVHVRKGNSSFRATIVMISDDRKFLEAELISLENEANKQLMESPQPETTAGPSNVMNQDYSASSSDHWSPTTSESSDESDDHERSSKRRKHSKHKRQRINESHSNGKHRKPTLKADAVIPKTSKQEIGDMKWSQAISNEKNVRIQYKMIRPSQAYERSTRPTVYNKHRPDNTKKSLIFDQQSQTEDLDGSISNINVMSALSVVQSTVTKLVQELNEMKRELGFKVDAPSSPSSGFSENHIINDPYTGHRKSYHVDTRRKNDEITHKDKRVNKSYEAVYDFDEEDLGPTPKRRSRKKLNEDTINLNDLLRSKEAHQQYEHESSSRSSRSPCATETLNGDMVAIGVGGTLVPRHIYFSIDWNSYTMATRKLLMAVFPRRTLATHSMTGKPSPAFTAKPQKLALDAKKVNDIVMTVSEKCRIKESLVRNAITTKCADENKMYRIRQLKKQKKCKQRSQDHDQENQPPEAEGEKTDGDTQNIQKTDRTFTG